MYKHANVPNCNIRWYDVSRRGCRRLKRGTGALKQVFQMGTSVATRGVSRLYTLQDALDAPHVEAVSAAVAPIVIGSRAEPSRTEDLPFVPEEGQGRLGGTPHTQHGLETVKLVSHVVQDSHRSPKRENLDNARHLVTFSSKCHQATTDIPQTIRTVRDWCQGRNDSNAFAQVANEFQRVRHIDHFNNLLLGL